MRCNFWKTHFCKIKHTYMQHTQSNNNKKKHFLPHFIHSLSAVNGVCACESPLCDIVLVSPPNKFRPHVLQRIEEIGKAPRSPSLLALHLSLSLPVPPSFSTYHSAHLLYMSQRFVPGCQSSFLTQERLSRHSVRTHSTQPKVDDGELSSCSLWCSKVNSV